VELQQALVTIDLLHGQIDALQVQGNPSAKGVLIP
jgi:hypothetical protein